MEDSVPIGLGPDELHVRSLRFADAASLEDRFERQLDDDERERSRRFATDELRRRWAIGRGAVREILAGYLGVAARDVQIVPQPCAACGRPHGKPALAPPAGGLHFNVSHTRRASSGRRRAGPRGRHRRGAARSGAPARVDRPFLARRPGDPSARAPAARGAGTGAASPLDAQGGIPEGRRPRAERRPARGRGRFRPPGATGGAGGAAPGALAPVARRHAGRHRRVARRSHAGGRVADAGGGTSVRALTAHAGLPATTLT